MNNKIHHFFLLSGILTLASFISVAQNPFVFRCTKDTIMACGTTTYNLKAAIPNIHASTDDYLINPLSATGCYKQYVETNTPGISANLTIDDRYSDIINLPFAFPFYGDAGSPYSSLVLSTNGYLSFDNARATLSSHWSMTAGNLPSTTYDRALIMGVYHDLDPSTGANPPADIQIKYEVVGDAPYRRFIFTNHHVPLFSSSCNSLVDNYHQIVLYESLGIIEVFVQGVDRCPTWNNGRKMIGIQNYNRNKGMMPPGRTATGPAWGAQNMNESWRFVPSAGASMFRGVELYDLSGNLVATGDTTSMNNGDLSASFQNISFPPGSPAAFSQTFVVKSRYESLVSPGTFVFGVDTINVSRPATSYTGVLSGDNFICTTTNTTLNSTVGGGVWSSENTAVATIDASTGFVTPVGPGTATLVYTVGDGSVCPTDTAQFHITISAAPVAAVLTGAQNLCNGNSNTITPSVPGGVWSSSNNNAVTVSPGGVVTAFGTTNATVTINYTLVAATGCADAVSSVTILTQNPPNAGTLSGFQSITVGDLSAISSSSTASGTWTSSNPTVATVDASGTVVALAAGTTTITFTVAGGGICPDASATILITVSQALPQNGSFTFSCNRDTTLPNCNNPCLDLKAVVPNIHLNSADYLINPISSDGCYPQYVFTSTPGISANLTIDDRYSSVVGLPFYFPFYGDAASPYNKLIVSTNGYLSFDVTKAGLFSHWSLAAGDLPNTSYDRSVIMGVYHDLDPGVNPRPADMQIKYEILGNAPYRRFIMSVHHVPLFSASCNSLVDNYHQVVLYESLGIIEVFVNGVDQCPGWNQGRKMIGLQNYNKDRGIMAPGRTATGPSWGSQGMNESWRFVPISGPSAFRNAELYDLQGNLIASTSTDTTTLATGDLGVIFNNVCLNNVNLTSDTTKFVIKTKYQSVVNPAVQVYGTDTLRIIAKVVKFANATFTNVKCKGEETGLIDVTATGGNAGTTYQYSINGGAIQNNGLFNNLPAGTYQLLVNDVSGVACPKDTTIILNEPTTAVDVDILQSNLFIPASEQIQLNSSSAGITSIQWTSVPLDATMSDPTLTNITATPSVNTMYYLEGIDAIGCTGKDSALVTVINTCLNVRNAFTPNGDGINDLWKVYDRRDCIADKLKVTVFNRYGSKVYESQDYWNSWNGSYKGSPLPDGTYYAVVEFFLPNKQRVVRKSDVNIIR